MNAISNLETAESPTNALCTVFERLDTMFPTSQPSYLLYAFENNDTRISKNILTANRLLRKSVEKFK